MGNQASKSPEERAQNVLRRVNIITRLAHRSIDAPDIKGDSLHQFLKRKALLEDDPEILECVGTAYGVPEEPPVDTICKLCELVTLYKIDGYMCRVCGSVFHKPCLAKSGRYTEMDMSMVDRAFTNVGWSCDECDNISILLNPEESEILNDCFEAFDTDKDCRVSEKEFLNVRKKLYKQVEGNDMPAEEVEYEKVQYHLLDDDGSGYVDYWEFMKHESAKVLLKRDKEDLVSMLTPREKWAAWVIFRYYDTNKDGTIDPVESAKNFQSWYTLFHELTSAQKCEEIKAPSNTAAHVLTARADLDDLEVDEDGSASISWQEFLRGQAIYIISARPNMAKLNKAVDRLKKAKTAEREFQQACGSGKK